MSGRRDLDLAPVDMNESGYDELATRMMTAPGAEVADGEIIEAGTFEVTEADRETDLIRASKNASVLGGVAALHGVIPDALTTMAMPAISDITSALVRVGWRRVHHAGRRPWPMQLKRRTWF